MDTPAQDAALAGWLAWAALAAALLAGVAVWRWWQAARSLRSLRDRTPLAQPGARLAQDVEVARLQARAAEQRLREVLDAIPGAIALYDNQDRLLALNQEAAQQPLYRGQADAIGMSYEDLVRRALAAGLVSEAVGREEEWLALRLAARAKTGLIRPVADGQWVHASEVHTPSGYLVTTRFDMAPLVERSLALERANGQLLRASTTDGLTGIANRRQFELALQGEWQRSARSQAKLSLLLVDIDQFKAYNDHYGHLAGDECLRQVARMLGLIVKRSGELVARHDGARFALLLPGVDADEARRVAERCLQQVQGARIPHAASAVAGWVTVSIGVATEVATPRLASSGLLEEAEQALLAAKQAGRARLQVFDALAVDSAPASLPAAL